MAQECGGSDGIIPARAGFTARRIGATIWRQDHPRSRGVYYARVRVRVERVGSSPLARGLREGELFENYIVGIIPARAGFTPQRTPQGSPTRDHPRSRGVYMCSMVRIT